MVSPEMTPYLWIVVLGGITGFVYAFAVGANDVANAFASTVSSKSLTLGQAVLAAAIFEFGGAFFLGSAVTGTVRSKIFDLKLYDDEPEIVLLGMFTSLVTSTVMLLTATYFSLPVSTTHTIVGSIMGFSIAAKGFASINGTVAAQIFISWIISPAASGAIALIIFGSIKYFIHSSNNAYQRAYYAFPLILTVFIGIDLFYILYKGLNNVAIIKKNLSLAWVLPVSFGVGAVCGLIWLLIVGPIARKRVEAKMLRDAYYADLEAHKEAVKQEKEREDDGDDEEVGEDDVEVSSDALPAKSKSARVTKSVAAPETADSSPEVAVDPDANMGFKERMSSLHASFAANTYGQDLHEQSFRESEATKQLWEEADDYDPATEQMFTYVQVFTACLNSFAHGANDIANAIAPVSAMFLIYTTGELNASAPVQKWVLAYGGVGLVVGLLLYGYKVMKSLGFQLTALSPSRGASAELAASLFVVTASYLEIPVSSTQSIVGAITGVGLVNGFKNVGWYFFFKCCIGWIVVFLSAVLVSAGFFSFMAFTPSLTE